MMSNIGRAVIKEIAITMVCRYKLGDRKWLLHAGVLVIWRLLKKRCRS